MKTLGNIIWFLFGGFLSGLMWLLLGLLYCVTLIGIPVGVQCFKFASVAFFPFGKTVTYSSSSLSVIVNIIWLLFGGIELALGYLVLAAIFCITIVGIPFGKQYMKLCKLALMPFGAKVTG